MAKRMSGYRTVGPRHAQAVTPSNTVDIQDADGTPIAGHIRADDAGVLVCIPEGNLNSDALITLNMAAGEVTQFTVRRVLSTGTTVTTLHVLF